MARAQNDVYMVCSDSSCVDNDIEEALKDGTLTRAELQRNAMNILGFIIDTHAMKRIMGEEDTVEIINRNEGDEASDEPVVFYEVGDSLKLDLTGIRSEKGKNHSFALIINKQGWYDVTVTASSTQSPLAQIPLTIFSMGTASGTLTWNGTDGKPVALNCEIPFFSRFTAIRLYFAQNGLDLHSIEFKLVREADDMDLAFAEDN